MTAPQSFVASTGGQSVQVTNSAGEAPARLRSSATPAPHVIASPRRAIRPTVSTATPQATVGMLRRATPIALRSITRLAFFLVVVGGFMLAVSQPVTAIPLAAVLIAAVVVMVRRG